MSEPGPGPATGDVQPPLIAVIDLDRCAGIAQCVQIAPDAFRLNDEMLAEFVVDGRWTRADLEDARDSCPTEAIRLVEQLEP